jgi:hypothetical protein
MNQHDALFVFTLLSYHTSTCFGPIIKRQNVYMGKWYLLDLEVKQIPFTNIYILRPNNGLQMGPKHVELW